MFEKLTAPIVKNTAAAQQQDAAWRVKNFRECEMKKHRVLSFLPVNICMPVAEIVTKFDLSHDVVSSDNNNDIVTVGFFADETYSVKIFELHMPYSEAVKLPND